MSTGTFIECPNHQGSFDCTPFCEVCEGEQAYNPADTLQCVNPECWEEVCKDVWLTELGFCVEHSNAYFNQELDPYTLERINNA
jgi:hypothetical protein